jgi:hypothetical protein
MYPRHPGKPRLLYMLVLGLAFCIPQRGSALGTGARNRHPLPEPVLIGTGEGLYSFDWAGKSTPLRLGFPVRKILRAGETWFIMGGEGILASPDLKSWENRNRGLPVKTLKIYEGGKKSFLPIIQEIKDLELNPAYPDIMVCATKDRAYLSRNGGCSWDNLGAPPFRTNGIKAVAVTYMPGEAGAASRAELTIFLSHSTYGLFYIHPDRPGFPWTELNGGLEKLETTGNTDEVSDIAVVLPGPGSRQNAAPQALWPGIYVSQTFRRRIYRLDWEEKQFSLLWSDNAPFGTVDSLDPGKSGLRFIREGAVEELPYSLTENQRPQPRPELLEFIRTLPASLDLKPNCIALPANPARPGTELISLSELWLLDEPDPAAAANTAAAGGTVFPDALTIPATVGSPARGREGLYLPVNHAAGAESLKPYLDIIRERGLNMVVVDMKDDYGRLRFTPQNPEITAKGRVFRPLDLESFLGDMKNRGIYTAARIVVFKDPTLASRDGGKYSVWDSRNHKPWAGYHDSRLKKNDPALQDRREDLTEILPADDREYEILRTYYDERWVDPYSEEVWEYTAAVAEELHRRGFDEIQFDYIRFPTDGVNLGDAEYRWQENGMDMESAMVSFLRHIRSRISAPISIDIYGANGWYRTGARTGQEVELLAPWVDIICPMYYPSHFEQDFLAQAPAELRPYRIYFQGTLRTSRIGRGQVIVRPYVQAFYLNVSYDRQYYNTDYVRRQAEGVRDAGGPGFTYWNNSGRYDDIPIFQPPD